jgi:hypothetical protein
MMRRATTVFLPGLLSIFIGCAPDQRAIEKVIVDGVKTQMNLDLASLDLKKRDDGSFAGTATAQNGDVYEVFTQPIKGGKVEWQVLPSQGMVDRTVRDGIEKQLSVKVLNLRLTKERPGVYAGAADLSNGKTLKVKTRLDGAQLLWEAE